MRMVRWMWVALVCLMAGCGPVTEEPQQGPEQVFQAHAERLAEEHGFDLRETVLVATPGVAGPRHELRFRGVPILGLGAKTAHGETRFTNARVEAGAPAETKPRLSPRQAEEAALARVGDASARVTGTRLVLLPREERRLRPGARAAPLPNAGHYERVVVGFSLIYQVELSTHDASAARDLPWVARVDALTGQVLNLDLLADAAGATFPPTDPNSKFRTVLGRGYFAGPQSFLAYYDPYVDMVELIDLHRNSYRGSGTFYSEDASFGDGQLYLQLKNPPSSANAETAGVDAYYGVNLTWTLFEVTLLRNGPNGLGKPLPVSVHVRDTNAYYIRGSDISPPRLDVGYVSLIPDPLTNRLTPLTTVDILAHELGHDFFVTELGADAPTGRSELAGMNEATGDIIAVLTELTRDAVKAGYPPGDVDRVTLRYSHVTLGEEVGKAYRDILTPQEREWVPDIGLMAPHLAAGPIGRMFFLLAYGCVPGGPLDGHCPRVPNGFAGIGPKAAGRIWARTVEALPAGADFLQARELALVTARFMDGEFSGVHQRAVANAFAAIAVGSLPDSNPPQVSMSCRQVAQDLECTGTISDAESPGEIRTLPLLTVDGLTPGYRLLDWQFTQTIPGASLAAGNHTLTLTAWDAWNNPASLSVVTALDKTGPQASVTRTGPPKAPVLTVQASDPSGILKVEFLDGTQLLRTVLTPPYSAAFNTSTWTDGTHAMVIKVYDRFSNVTTLNHALLVDNILPRVTMTVGTGDPPFNVNASVTDASPITRVDFKVDGVVFATRTTSSASYQATYTPTDELAHNLYVEVTDSFGNKGVAMQAAPRDLKPPGVTFNASQWGATVRLTVNVSDTCGIQYPYGLYVDGALVASATTPGHVLEFFNDTLAAGAHAFHAIVRDNCGNTANFEAVFFKYFTPPVITSITRDDTQPKKPKFTVQCTDTEGVHHVEMRENGVVVQSDNTAPYEFVVDTSTRTEGDYSMLFHCTDIYGVSSETETVTVTADNSGPLIQNFTVFGSGRSYFVSAGSVSDPRGIKSVILSGGLVTPSFDSGPLTQAPYNFQWLMQGTAVIQTELPFYVQAEDKWGNKSSRSYLCYVNTNSTQNAFLSCH